MVCGDVVHFNNILIIDDEPFVLDILSHFLANAGFNIQNARSGKEAIEYFKYNQFDLILLDVYLKNEKFSDVLGQIVQITNEAIPIMAVTGSPMLIQDKDKKYLKYILEKPFTPDELLDVIVTKIGLKPTEL